VCLSFLIVRPRAVGSPIVPEWDLLVEYRIAPLLPARLAEDKEDEVDSPRDEDEEPPSVKKLRKLRK
jgi:hypothetical protein